MIRILIADDHAIMRRGIRDILLEKYPHAVIEEVADTNELLNKALSEEWDIVITDVSMPGRSGLEALQEIKLQMPKLPVLVLSVYPEDHYAMRVLKAGASGYLSKEMAPDELVNAVSRVLSGNKYITASIAERLITTFRSDSDKLLHENLSDREFEVFKMIASGKSISDIGAMLGLGATTVSTYRSRVLAKMNMRNNVELIQYAIENKLI
jgi:two-component system invasion response regulator UvrY